MYNLIWDPLKSYSENSAIASCCVTGALIADWCSHFRTPLSQTIYYMNIIGIVKEWMYCNEFVDGFRAFRLKIFLVICNIS